MASRFQIARADGHPDWSPGQVSFADAWDHAHDLLRFHRGSGFVIRSKAADTDGPVRKLSEVAVRLEAHLIESRPDEVWSVRSLLDNYTLVFRQHEVAPEKGQLVVAHAKTKLGTPYLFGTTDCSWLTLYAYGQEGVDFPHNAHLQHLDSQVIEIPKTKLLPGDLIFIHDDAHVALFLDYEGPGGTMRVLDTEPSDTGAPAGWPSPRLGTGVRVRPAFGGYYCAFANGYGRVVKINGPV